LSEIYIERGRKRNNREAEKELDELKAREEKEKEVMPDALSPNCYPILSHKLGQDGQRIGSLGTHGAQRTPDKSLVKVKSEQSE